MMQRYRWVDTTVAIGLVCWIVLVPDDPQVQHRFRLLGVLAIALTWWCLSARWHAWSWLQRGVIAGPLTLLAATLVGSSRAADPVAAWNWATRSLLPGAAVYATALAIGLRHDATKRWVLWALCGMGTVAAALGLYEFLAHRNPLYEGWIANIYYEGYRQMGRVMSTQSHPAAFGFLMVACVSVAIALSEAVGSGRTRWLAVICAALSGLMLPTSFSRGSMIGAAVAVSIYGLLMRRPRWVVSTVLALAGLIAWSSMASWSHASDRFDWHRLLHDPIYEYRLHRLVVTGRIMQDHPFVGVGLNHFRLRFNDYTDDPGPPIPDNMHLLIAAETGGIGALGWCGFLCALLIGGVRIVRQSAGLVNQAYAAGLVCATVGMLCNFLTYDTLYWMGSGSLFWLIAGLLAAEVFRSTPPKHQRS